MLDIFNDDWFMNEALKEAQFALDQGEVPVGAVVVANNKVVSRGHNQTELLKDSTAHAEMLALTGAYDFFRAKYVPDCTLFVTLEPCVMCAGALYWSQIKRIVFGASDGKRGYSVYNTNILHPKTSITEGVRAEESEALLKQFFARIRDK